MFDTLKQELDLLMQEQIENMEACNMPRDTIRLFKNRMSRLCDEDRLLVLRTHNPFNPNDCLDVLHEL